jgi:hypothetical protein
MHEQALGFLIGFIVLLVSYETSAHGGMDPLPWGSLTHLWGDEVDAYWWIENNITEPVCKGQPSGVQLADGQDASSYYICCGSDKAIVRHTCFPSYGLGEVMKAKSFFNQKTGKCTK